MVKSAAPSDGIRLPIRVIKHIIPDNIDRNELTIINEKIRKLTTLCFLTTSFAIVTDNTTIAVDIVIS